MIRIDHLTDYRPRVLASLAKARGLKVILTKHDQDCTRCSGRGWFPSKAHGACFRCGGDGVERTKATRRHVGTPPRTT